MFNQGNDVFDGVPRDDTFCDNTVGMVPMQGVLLSNDYSTLSEQSIDYVNVLHVDMQGTLCRTSYPSYINLKIPCNIC